jgi:NADH-ubiquinone oxidoreductase chain 2
VLAIYRTMVGAIGGLNQTSTRKIIAFSSINHLGWINSTIIFNSQVWIKYFILYATITLIVSTYIITNSVFYINQLKSNTSIINKINITVIIISLGGLPPFLGFLPKWLVIQTLIINNINIIILIIIMRTLLTLFYYLRIIRRIIIINKYSIKWELKNKNNATLMVISIILNIILPIISITRLY